jgi:Fur family ferric uptake transcriptional regulator
MDYRYRIFKAFLKFRGLKCTPERRRILDAVFSLEGHFDVEELYGLLREKRSGISRATIYRTIPLLIESGMIREALRCRKNVRYEHIFGHKHHDHMVCVGCGKVIEFKDDKIEELQDRMCRLYGFTPIEHRLGIRGYCKKCSGLAKRSVSRGKRAVNT